MTPDGQPAPHNTIKQLSKPQIMAATAAVLREAGYDATTIRTIAKALDCAVGSIYRYFRDKRQLLFAVAQSAMEPAAALVEAGGSLQDSARLYHELAASDPALYRLMFWLASMNGAAKVNPEPDASPEAPTPPAAAAAPSATDADTTGEFGLPGPVKPGQAPDRRRAARFLIGPHMPPVICRVIEGWSRRLGDSQLAGRCWINLHGAVIVGLAVPQSQALLTTLLQHGDGRAARGQRPAVKHPTPEGDRGNEMESPTSVPQKADATGGVESPDDVCLL